MSQAAMAPMKSQTVGLLALVAFLSAAVAPAKADPCAESCRSQHNACRMAAKLLFPARCDAQLQACISQCFAAGRFNRERQGRETREFRDRRDMRPPPDMRGPPEMRGPPREFRDFRDQGPPRYLGGRAWWRNR